MTPPRTRIKMCGMTRANDIAHAIALGVDAIGLIFYPKSSRYVNLAEAKSLLQTLPAFVNAVAVFVNPEVDFVTQVINELPVQCLQFHGDESPEFCGQFGLPYIKVVSATSLLTITQMVTIHPKASAILLDTPSSTARGGSGVTFDWQIIPKLMARPLILAGGLDSLNVSAAITACAPYAVDVCSGIEVSPGIKDHEKMSQFVTSVREKK